QSIMEMWQSPKARNLYYISQNEIRPESKCKTCVEFSDCRRPVGICWKEVVMAYGNENWDYPTPGCPLAPIPINDICIR
ncbi:MAG: radical SAM protein, partial [Bacteroidales bacterium]